MNTRERLGAACLGTLFDGRVHHFTTIDSTNRIAVDRGRLGYSGEVFLADEQTAGRGRGGHSWRSARGDGLYLSVLLRPELEMRDALKLSLTAGIAAQAAAMAVSATKLDIRWPNDLVAPSPDGRKVGGILTETSVAADGSLLFCVIGIGINLNQVAMPDDLQSISTSLRMLSGRAVEREQIAAELLQRLSTEIVDLQRDPAFITTRFASASSWVEGKRVSVAEDGGYTGITEGLSATGLLRVRCEDGLIREVRHGGVREA